MLASLVLLATLLAGLLAAKSGAERRWSGAEQRLRALAAVDTLVSGWLSPDGSDPERVAGIPIDDTGVLPGVDGWRWETAVLDDESAAVLRCRVVRLSVVDPARVHDPALLTLDLLAPLPEAGVEDPNPGDGADGDASAIEGDG